MTRTFAIKIVAATALVALADSSVDAGATLGGFALAWIAALALTRPAIRHGQARVAALAAAGFALVLADDPGLLAWTLFWVATALAVLLPRHRFDDAFAFARRIAVHAIVGLARPFGDLVRLSRVRKARRGEARGLRAIAAVLALPVGGGGVFLALFASANPLIGEALATIAPPDAWTIVGHVVLWTGVGIAIWSSFRPHRLATAHAAMPRLPRYADVPLATFTLSLVTFNALFAIENALDLVFLWSGATLPSVPAMKDYAHQGAYSLIATTLLAALFVLVALRPGSVGERSVVVRRLVYLWLAQNLLLVASSILRTLAYIEAYSLTVLRIAALAWMTLVAVGIALIAWRLLRGRSAAWLVNANAAAAAVVLAVASVVDLGAVAAAWDVAHAPEGGGKGPPLDLCYIESLGGSALVPLARLEPHVRDAGLRDRIAYIRAGAAGRIAEDQSDWRSWTWRDSRRLATVAAMPKSAPLRPAPDGRACGRILPPPELTPGAER